SLNPKTGDVLWQSDPVPRAKEIRTFYLPTLLLYENVVLFSGGETAGLQTGSWYETGKDTLTALSADTGKRLWKSYHPPSGYRSPEDTLVAGGLVWLGETTSGRAKGVFRGLDPHTGEVKVQFAPDVETYWFHHRCYRSKATDRYLLVSRTGTEFVDFRNKHWDINHWVRGACLYGVMPANGLLYAPQHPCACYLEAKLVGFNALSASRPSSKPAQLTPAERLERGPAYDNIETVNRQPSAPKPRPSADWPTYRHDPARSGRATTKVPTSLRTAWQAKIGGRLTSPAIADGRVFVASIDTHTLHVLDMDTGKPLWQFTAGGRIDSPPTVFEGLVLFGSADGYVYALRASDGAMAWRFLAAPADQRLVAFEQLESAWPVPGNVLVYDGVVYCVAGRSMFLDGGMRLWRLDAKTGRVLSETVLDDRDRQANKDLQSYVSWLNMPPALPDVLSCDGRYVYMRSQPFHLDGTRPPLKPMPRRSDADRGAPPPIQHQQYAHLFSPTGFLDDTGWHRTYWLYGSTFVSGWSGYYLAGRAAPAGRILVFDDTHVYGFGRKPKYYRWTTPIEHQLFATTKTLPRLTDTGDSERRISVVRVEKSKSLNPAGKAITVEAWVNSHQPNGVIVARGGTVHGYALYVKDGRPHFAIRADSKVAVVAAKKKITGWWSHVAGVLTQQKQLRLYVDGELVAQGRATSLIPHDPQEGLTVGMDEQSTVGDYGSPFGLDGMIDELRIYHRALSQTEIAQHAAGGKADTTDLVLYFSFDSNKAQDESGNGNDGTIERARPVRGKVGRAFRFVGQALPAPGYVVEHHWTETVPMFVRAMVLADGTLFIAGPPDLVDEEKAFRRIRDPEVQKQLVDQAEAYAGKKGGLLWAVSAEGGQKLGELRLPAPPVFDGLAAAQKRLFLSTMDGQVLCLSGE
ncbi:MAG: PQQ-binding-like beta-propeller repeat protein, partial [Planctomycetes bacterium]|nr:PQQ-binding-like beta-propeller repeat protein [Planctomycetota bacterium]